MSDREFEMLINRYLEGLSTSADVEQLNHRLRNDALARKQFTEILNLDAALSENAAGWSGQPQFTVAIRKNRRRQRLRAATGTLVSVCLLLAAILVSRRQAPTAAFATVQRGIGTGILDDGTPVRAEDHKLSAGTVEFITANGARVVIEAPAAFRFESAQMLHVTRGRVSADVPPAAKGFTVVTPTGRAVDLGTTFGVDVPDQGAAEVHVFKGEVIAQPQGSQTGQSLRDGSALVLSSGAGTAREIRSAAFIHADEMDSLSAGLAAGQREHAEAALQRLRRDPALITLLDFESVQRPPGAFRIVQGRWPGSHAPEFVNVGDHMTLAAGEDRAWPQLSLAAWVRLDRLGEPYQSLYHTDGWEDDKLGQVHWMITDRATMRLALRRNIVASDAGDGTRVYPDSQTSVLPERGRWVHLAVAYDSTAQTVRFYRNGQFDNEVPLRVAHPARLGPAQIGNWNRQDRKLSGRVDEFLLLGRALSDDEVRMLYEAGNPYR